MFPVNRRRCGLRLMTNSHFADERSYSCASAIIEAALSTPMTSSKWLLRAWVRRPTPQPKSRARRFGNDGIRRSISAMSRSISALPVSKKPSRSQLVSSPASVRIDFRASFCASEFQCLPHSLGPKPSPVGTSSRRSPPVTRNRSMRSRNRLVRDIGARSPCCWTAIGPTVRCNDSAIEYGVMYRVVGDSVHSL